MSRRGMVLALFVGCTGPAEPGTVPEIVIDDTSIELLEDGTAPLVLSAFVATGEALTYRIVDQPALGKVVGSGSVFEYVAERDANGTDRLTWRASLADGTESDLATVDILIEPVNDAPVGTPGSLTTHQNARVSGQLEATDVEDATLTFLIMVQPANGTLILQKDGRFEYAPDPPFVGVDTFTWTAQDQDGASAGPVTFDITVGS